MPSEKTSDFAIGLETFQSQRETLGRKLEAASIDFRGQLLRLERSQGVPLTGKHGGARIPRLRFVSES